MSGQAVMVGPVFGIVLAVLALAAAVAVRLAAIGSVRAVLTAAVRAALQLAAVSLIVASVLRSGWLTAAFVLLMVSVASVTSAGRLGARRRAWWVAVPIVAGIAPVLALLLGSTLIPARPIAVVPIAGILIGGAMTATSLAGRRCRDELRARYGEYEAALALGLSRRDAVLLVCRPVAGAALVPALDQTRTVGLVTLPGAFVGVLLGGASPIQAGATQLLVLIGLLAVEAVAVIVVVELLATARIPMPAPGQEASGGDRSSR